MNETVEDVAETNEAAITMLSPGQIRISEIKLRDVDREDPQFLSIVNSIEERRRQGLRSLIMPISVRPQRDPESGAQVYFIIDGLQRYSACIEAGEDTIPCIIEEGLSDIEYLKQQFQANFSKVNQRPAQAGDHLARMMADDPTMTVNELCRISAQPKSQIEKFLKLTKLTDSCKEAVDSKEISVANAVLLAKLPTEEQDNFLDSARTKPSEDFKLETTARLKELRKAKMEAREARGPIFEPQIKMRSKKVLTEEFEDDNNTVAQTLLSARELTTPLEGFQLAIAWMLNANSEAINEQKAAWEAEQAEKAEKAKLREAAKQPKE